MCEEVRILPDRASSLCTVVDNKFWGKNIQVVMLVFERARYVIEETRKGERWKMRREVCEKLLHVMLNFISRKNSHENHRHR